MAFTEFYCESGGANINGGSNAGAVKYTSTNGNWDGTSIFTPTDGTNPSNSIAVGDFTSVYNDGATLAVYIARVTVVQNAVNGTVTLSTTSTGGTAPTNSATGRSIKVGGAWKGPNAAQGFPFNFALSAMTNSNGDMVRVNCKNDATYSITANIPVTTTLVRFQGYSSTIGDGGKATIDGGTVGTSYIMLSFGTGSTDCQLFDFILQNNGATGTANGLNVTNIIRGVIKRVVVHDVRGTGISVGTTLLLLECEAYNCNKGSLAAGSGIVSTSPTVVFRRCISHDNTTGTTPGFRISSTGISPFPLLLNCISDSNSGSGLILIQSGNGFIGAANCDFYNNTSHGISLESASSSANFSALLTENCNLVKNGGYGINGAVTSTTKIVWLLNNAYGSGTQANSSGNTNSLGTLVELSPVNYASNVTPWVDPANGDFRINLVAARNSGRGVFIETQGGYAGTIGYPDIGAAQHRDTEKSFTFGL